MPDAVIVGAVRTPVGRRKGGLAGIHPVDLSGHVLRALASRTGFDQGVGAEMIAARWGFSRTQLDEFALASHAKAAAAQDAGEFDAEIVPVESVKQDEGIRRDSTLAKLAELKTPFKEDGVVTAGS